jgi:hypothetical protein
MKIWSTGWSSNARPRSRTLSAMGPGWPLAGTSFRADGQKEMALSPKTGKGGGGDGLAGGDLRRAVA